VVDCVFVICMVSAHHRLDTALSTTFDLEVAEENCRKSLEKVTIKIIVTVDNYVRAL